MLFLWRDIMREWRGAAPSRSVSRLWSRMPAHIGRFMKRYIMILLFVPDALLRLTDIMKWRRQSRRFRKQMEKEAPRIVTITHPDLLRACGFDDPPSKVTAHIGVWLLWLSKRTNAVPA